MLEELEDRHNVVQDEVASSNVDTHGFVGADIQALVNLALLAAREERKDICMELGALQECEVQGEAQCHERGDGGGPSGDLV